MKLAENSIKITNVICLFFCELWYNIKRWCDMLAKDKQYAQAHNQKLDNKISSSDNTLRAVASPPTALSAGLLHQSSDNDIIFGRPRSSYASLIEIPQKTVKSINRRITDIITRKEWKPVIIQAARQKIQFFAQIYDLCNLNDDNAFIGLLNEWAFEIFVECHLWTLIRASPLSARWIDPTKPLSQNSPPTLPAGVVVGR